MHRRSCFASWENGSTSFSSWCVNSALLVRLRAFWLTLLQAPGACALARAGVYPADSVAEKARRMQPHLQVVDITDVHSGLSTLATALGLEPVADIKARTEDWPFVD